MSDDGDEYERFVCKRLEGRPKAVYLKIQVANGEWVDCWVPRSQLKLIKNADKPGGDVIVEIKTWFVKQEIRVEENDSY